MTGIRNRNTTEAAHGRWKEILRAFGVSEQILNGKAQPCPFCAGTDRFTYDDRTKNGDYICRRCGAGNGFQFVMKLKGWDFKQTAYEIDRIIGNQTSRPVKRKSSPTQPPDRAYLRQLYTASRAITVDDPAGRYLMARGIIGPWPKALRYLPRMKHSNQSWHPGMLAVYSDANGIPASIHRTFLTEDGSKADVRPARMFVVGKLPESGAIRLAPEGETLGIAEGIESALAAMQLFNIPVWAAGNAGLLQKWKPPPKVRHVMIFSDNDDNTVGQAAAYTLSASLKLGPEKDLIVEVMIPPRSGSDWNDVINNQEQGETICEH